MPPRYKEWGVWLESKIISSISSLQPQILTGLVLIQKNIWTRLVLKASGEKSLLNILTDRHEIWNDYCKFPNIKKFSLWIKLLKKGRRKKERKRERKEWERERLEEEGRWKDERERGREETREWVRKEGQGMGIIIIGRW